MSDNVRQRGQADPMAFDVSKAALPALWKSDPAFVELAKYLYGDEVTLETVQKDLFGKNEPAQSDVHINEPLKVGRKKKPMVVDERALQGVGKAFIDLVEKAYDADLIDDEGNLNAEEIEKSRQYVRDHAGKFASQGKHTGRMIGGLVAAGALAGTGAVMAAKSPKTAKYAAESVKFVGQHLKSRDPVERHVARSLLPHALKATGRAVGTAGLGATASAGSVYEGTKTYNDIRNRAVHGPKAARLDEVEKLSAMALRAGAEYVSRGTRTAERIGGYGPKHAARLTRLKRLRGLVGNKVRETALDPTAPATTLRELTKPLGDITKADRTYRRDSSGRFIVGGTAVAAAGAGVAATAADAADDAKEQRNKYQARQGDAMIRHELADPVPVGAEERAHHGFHPSEKTWADHARVAEQGAKSWEDRAKLMRRTTRAGTAGMVAGAALAGYGAYEMGHHKKNLDDHDVVWEGDFSKVDEDKHQVFGWASVTQMDGKPVVDLQGDYIHPEDMEVAAYDYVLKSRVGGDMHTRVDEYGNVIEKSDKAMHVSDLIESMVFTPEKCEAMGVDKSLAGSWWVGFKVNDPDVWDTVKNGERTGFSIHGAGLRKSIDITELDPEAELIGKAYQESDDVNQFIDNLCTLEDVTGHEGFGDLAKHLAHGITAPQINAQQGRNAGVYGSMASGAGALAGGAIGAKFGHPGEGAGIGAGIGGLGGTAFGVHHGKDKPQRPQRPPSLQGMGMKAARAPEAEDYFGKGVASVAERLAPKAEKAFCGTCGGEVAHFGPKMGLRHLEPGRNVHAVKPHELVYKGVDNTNRMGGSVGVRQNMYQQQALQEATQMLAPQVAQHIQAMQEQRWQQQMMEQQMLAQQAQQQPQNFAVQMGPYANHQSGGQRSHGNPLAPSQQGPTTGSEPQMPPTPQTFSV